MDNQPVLKNEKPVSAPATIDLSDGKHEISISKDGFETISKPVEIKAAAASLDLSKIVPKKVDKKAARAAITGPVDVLKLFNLKEPGIVKGDWQLDNGALVSPVEAFSRIAAKFTPPEEYLVTLVIERIGGNNDFVVGLSLSDKQFAVDLDAFESTICGIDSIGGKRCGENVTRQKGRQVLTNKPTTVTIAVRKTEISVAANSRKLFAWKPELEGKPHPAQRMGAPAEGLPVRRLVELVVQNHQA